jgi:hypothetical protein
VSLSISLSLCFLCVEVRERGEGETEEEWRGGVRAASPLLRDEGWLRAGFWKSGAVECGCCVLPYIHSDGVSE